jgi:hypothetical protein
MFHFLEIHLKEKVCENKNLSIKVVHYEIILIKKFGNILDNLERILKMSHYSSKLLFTHLRMLEGENLLKVHCKGTWKCHNESCCKMIIY